MSAVMGDYFVALYQAHGDQEQLRLAAEAFAAKQFAMPLVTKILFGVVGAVFFAVGLALGPGLLASATRELLGGESEAAVFAAAEIRRISHGLIWNGRAMNLAPVRVAPRAPEWSGPEQSASEVGPLWSLERR